MIRATRAEAERLLADTRDPVHDGVDYAAMLRRHLIGMFTSGTISSKALVVLCWYITMAGGQGVSDLGHNPASLHGNASRVVGTSLGSKMIQEGCLMEFAVPLYNRATRKLHAVAYGCFPSLKSWHWNTTNTKLVS